MATLGVEFANSTSTGMNMPSEWRDVMIAGLCVDVIGICACSAMLLYIIVYR